MAVRQKEIDPSKVAIYIRWSTDDQTDGTTLEVQTEGCKHYLLSQGWAFSQDLVFIDEGYSGGTLERPAMIRLREAVKAGRVDCVVVFKLDRLSRSVVDTVRLVLEEWDGFCHVKSAREPIDTTNHAGKMFFYMLVSYAEWERAVIRERTFSGKLKRAQAGRNPGFRPPYGYVTGATAGSIEIHPGEASVVERIFSLYRQGLGANGITYRLNGEGLRFREGRPWEETTLRKILMNPMYCGDLRYGLRTRNPSHGKREGEPYFLYQEPYVEKQGAVPAIIPRDEWNAVQAIRTARPGATRGTSGRSHSSRHLLSSIARCKCGHAIIGYKGGGKTEWYYRCSGQRKKGKTVCQCGYIRQDAVDALILDKLKREFGDKVAQDRYYEQTVREGRQLVQQARDALAVASKASERLEESSARVRKLLRDGVLTVEEFRDQKADIDKEAATLHLRVAALGRTIRESESALALRSEERDLSDKVLEIEQLNPEHRKQILRSLVESVTLYRLQGSEEVLCEVKWKWALQRPTEIQDVTFDVEN